MAAQHLRESTRPAATLFPQLTQRWWDLHPYHRTCLVAHVPEAALQLPGHVDVFRRHVGRKEPRIDERTLAERGDRAGHRQHTPPDALRAPLHRYDGGEFQRLQVPQERSTIGNARIARDGRDTRGEKVRHERAQHLRRHHDVGVHDDHEFAATHRERVVEPHRLAFVHRLVEQPHLACVDQPANDVARAIGGPIVHHDDLEVGVIDAQQRPDGARDRRFLGVRRNEDRDHGRERRAVRHGRNLGVVGLVLLSPQRVHNAEDDPHARHGDRVESVEEQRAEIDARVVHRMQHGLDGARGHHLRQSAEETVEDGMVRLEHQVAAHEPELGTGVRGDSTS